MSEEKLLQHISSLIELYHSEFQNDVKHEDGRNSKNYSNQSKLLSEYDGQFSKQWRGVQKNTLTKEETQKVSQALLELQRGLTGKRNLAGNGYMQNKNFLGAYLLYYWPISYLQVSFIAYDIKSKIEGIVAKTYESSTNCNSTKKNRLRILDLGSGPAPATVALLDSVLEAQSSSLRADIQIEVTLIDSSEKALTMAKKILSKDFPSVKVRTVVCNFEKQQLDLQEDFDLIVSCHVINELWKEQNNCIEKRSLFLEKISFRLKEDGAMIICEPALLLTSRNLIQVRDSLLKKGLNVISPCIFVGEKKCSNCPVLATENHTCHAEVMWKPIEPVASLAWGAGLDRESVKMTYFVFIKQFADYSLENIVARTAVKNELTGRIVSEGMLNKAGRIRFLVCDGTSRIAVSAKKDDLYAKEIGFFKLKRYDIVKFSFLEIRGDKNNTAYGICEETKLEFF